MSRNIKLQVYITILRLIAEKSLATDCSLDENIYWKCHAPCLKPNDGMMDIGYNPAVTVSTYRHKSIATFFTSCFDEFGLRYWPTRGAECEKYQRMPVEVTEQIEGQPYIYYVIPLESQNLNYSFQFWGRQYKGSEDSKRDNFYTYVINTNIDDLRNLTLLADTNILYEQPGYCYTNPKVTTVVDGDGRCGSASYAKQHMSAAIVGFVSFLISKCVI